LLGYFRNGYVGELAAWSQRTHNDDKQEIEDLSKLLLALLRGAIQKFPKHINENYYVLPEPYSAPSPRT
jgi:hypothetical protein